MTCHSCPDCGATTLSFMDSHYVPFRSCRSATPSGKIWHIGPVYGSITNWFENVYTCPTLVQCRMQLMLRLWCYLWVHRKGRAPKGMWTVRSGRWQPSPPYQHDLRASCNTQIDDRLTPEEKLRHMLSLVLLYLLNLKPRISLNKSNFSHTLY